MRIIAVLFVSVSFLYLGCNDKVSDSRVVELLKTKEVSMVDVRTNEEYAAGHVEGSINIPINDLPAAFAKIPTDKPVVVYCKTGGRSAKAATFLENKGYEVYDAKRWDTVKEIKDKITK